MPHQVVGLCGGLCIALVQSEPKEETVFVSLSLWGCRHSCNWNALHVADWRDNLLAMCFSHSHVMRLGSGCRDFIYILVKKKKKKKGKRKGTCQEKIGKLSWCMNRRAGQGRFIRGSYCIGDRRVPRAGQCVRRGHSFGTHGTLKHGITAVTTINFGMGSVGIMTYSWRTSSYWPDRQYWFIEETPMLSWQPEVMVGGNRAGDEEGCSLSSELYCCYRFPIRKRDGPLYWPTTSHESLPQSHRPAEAIFPRCISEQMWYSAVTLLCVCVCVCVSVCLVCLITLYSWWSVACLCFLLQQHSCVRVVFLSWQDRVRDGRGSSRKRTGSSEAVCWRMQTGATGAVLAALLLCGNVWHIHIVQKTNIKCLRCVRMGWIGWKGQRQIRPIQAAAAVYNIQ